MRKRDFLKAVCAFILLLGVFSCSSDPDEPEIKVPDEEQKDPEPEPEVPSPEPEPEPGDDIEPEFGFEFYAGKMDINTAGGVKISSKEDYVDCSISIDHINSKWNLDNVEAEIRGRGNSSWKWYDKKPYRIKFKKKQSVLGLDEAKSWVLLAEYRDPTDLMNTFVFELGQLAGMPFTNHNRYVEVNLNGEYIGLYHVTEQVQQNKARVNIDEKEGYLLNLDADDGPDLAPNATDNFWSSVYYMPVCIKNPENLDNNIISAVKSDLSSLERAIYNFKWETIEDLLDVKSMADFLIIQELVYNVELDAPRSMYIHKNPDSKWTMGPLWDFDAGFDFDWGTMYTGHNFFSNYRELVLGTNPFTHAGTQYRVPGFFSDLFYNSEFIEIYRERWNEISCLVPTAWDTSYTYFLANKDAFSREAQRWKIDKKYDVEIERMHSWILNRIEYLNTIISNY